MLCVTQILRQEYQCFHVTGRVAKPLVCKQPPANHTPLPQLKQESHKRTLRIWREVQNVKDTIEQHQMSTFPSPNLPLAPEFTHFVQEQWCLPTCKTGQLWDIQEKASHLLALQRDSHWRKSVSCPLQNCLEPSTGLGRGPMLSLN